MEQNTQELLNRLNHSGKKLSKSHRRIAECIKYEYSLRGNTFSAHPEKCPTKVENYI